MLCYSFSPPEQKQNTQAAKKYSLSDCGLYQTLKRLRRESLSERKPSDLPWSKIWLQKYCQRCQLTVMHPRKEIKSCKQEPNQWNTIHAGWEALEKDTSSCFWLDEFVAFISGQTALHFGRQRVTQMLEQHVVVICFCIKSNVKSSWNIHAIKTDCFVFEFNVSYLIHVIPKNESEHYRCRLAWCCRGMHLGTIICIISFSKDQDCAGVLNNAGPIQLWKWRRCNLCWAERSQRKSTFFFSMK